MESKSARCSIGVQRNFPKEFAQPASSGAAVELHLPKAVLRVGESLCKEDIVTIGRVDVGHAPLVANDFDRGRKPRRS